MERELLEQILTELRAIRAILEEKTEGKGRFVKEEKNLSNLASIPRPEANESSEKPLDIGYEFIINSLKMRGLKVKDYTLVENGSSTWDKLALFMGKHFRHIKLVYKHIKKTLSSGEFFTVSLKGLPQETISYITNWCTELHQLALLEEYKYSKSPYFLLRARINRTPEVINFFTGGWLELFVIEVVKRTLREKGFSPYMIRNVKVEYPNGDEGEFDLFLNLKSNLFWFESKAGEYQSHISKYSKIAKMFSLPKERSFIILAEITPDKAKDLGNLYNMSVSYVEDFPSLFKERVEKFTIYSTS
ncbi:hypothetical protein [Thermovibrio sp.]